MKDYGNPSLTEAGWLIGDVESIALQFVLFLATLLSVGGTAAAPSASLAGSLDGCRRVLSKSSKTFSVGLL